MVNATTKYNEQKFFFVLFFFIIFSTTSNKLLCRLAMMIVHIHAQTHILCLFSSLKQNKKAQAKNESERKNKIYEIKIINLIINFFVLFLLLS